MPTVQPASAKRLPSLRHAVAGHRGARRTTPVAALYRVLHRSDAVLRGDVLLAAALLADAFAWNTVAAATQPIAASLTLDSGYRSGVVRGPVAATELPVLRPLRSRSQPR
ncbi:hypothetical protein EMIT048CA2_10049 [Pseudomonas chlororaphis]